jgi:hypothetical protein
LAAHREGFYGSLSREVKNLMAVDLRRRLLDLRESIEAVKTLSDEYGYTDQLPELEKLGRLERKIFGKVNKWDKPSE